MSNGGHADFSSLEVRKGYGVRFEHADNSGAPTADYRFPVTGGAAGQVLTSDGGLGGQLYWSDKTAATEPWYVSGTTDQATSNTQDIYQSGKVGIGVANPSEKLEINGAIKVGDGGYTGISNNDTSPIPAGGAGTIIFSNGNFYGWNGTNWKQLDN